MGFQMSDNQNQNGPVADPVKNDAPVNGPKDNDAANGGADQAADSEANKWKALSRKNETELERVRKELEQYKTASMSDAEKAIEAAKEEGRKAALSEVGTKLAEAEIRSVAANSGRKVPDGLSEYLNLSAFVGDDGNPNSDAITAFITSLPEAQVPPRFPQNTGLGPQGNTSTPQLTRADMARMTPQEIVKARQEGRFNNLLNGTT
jgi:hypothetical protein